MRRVSVRQLRNNTAEIVEAVRAGERVTLTVRDEPVADIVPHGGARQRFRSLDWLYEQLGQIPSGPTWLDELLDDRRSEPEPKDPWERYS